VSQGADVTGVRVLVTGGTSGLGLAMAAALAEGGARVVLTGRDAARAEQAAGRLTAAGVGDWQGEVHGIAMDVRDERSVADGVDRTHTLLGGLDALVNNAGLGMRTVNERFLTDPQPFYAVEPGRFRDLLDTNVLGYFLVARAVVPGMVRAGRGTVVNVGINEETTRRRGFVPYGPSRAATDAMSHVMAADLEGTGVDVHLLRPGGATLTGMIPDGLPVAARAQLLDPSVMGPAIRWLCSPQSAGRTDLTVTARDFTVPTD
jgi:gluconate 5-dehydrogenase